MKWFRMSCIVCEWKKLDLAADEVGKGVRGRGELTSCCFAFWTRLYVTRPTFVLALAVLADAAAYLGVLDIFVMSLTCAVTRSNSASRVLSLVVQSFISSNCLRLSLERVSICSMFWIVWSRSLSFWDGDSGDFLCWIVGRINEARSKMISSSLLLLLLLVLLAWAIKQMRHCRNASARSFILTNKLNRKS